MNDHADPRARLDQKVSRKAPQVFQGLVAGRSPAIFIHGTRSPAHGPAVVIAANGGDLSLLEERDDPVGERTVADQVAGADDPVHLHRDQVGPGKLEGDRVAVNIGDEPQLHRLNFVCHNPYSGNGKGTHQDSLADQLGRYHRGAVSSRKGRAWCGWRELLRSTGDERGLRLSHRGAVSFQSEKRGVQAARNGPSLPPCVAKAEISTADRLGSREGSSRAGWRELLTPWGDERVRSLSHCGAVSIKGLSLNSRGGERGHHCSVENLGFPFKVADLWSVGLPLYFTGFLGPVT